MNDGSVHSDLESTGDGDLDAVFARLAADVAELNDYDLTALVRLDSPSTGLHAAARNLELLRRRLGLFDAHYVAAVDVGDEPARYARPSTAVFLREQLRLTRGEAKRRVDLAKAIAPTTAFTGEVLPAPLPVLAAAVTAGVVSGDHARTIIETLRKLPTPIREAHGPVVEAEMVDAASKVTPADLDALATEVMVRADPDGRLRDADYAHQHRDLRLVRHRGRAGGRLIVELDDEGLELATVTLDALSKPTPTPEPDDQENPVSRDQRPLAERRYDGLVHILKTVLNAGDLPASGGTPAATVCHLTDRQLRNRYGLAVSEHGTLIPVTDALRLADQSAFYLLITSCTGVPLHLGRTSRIATPGQTTALAARDRGCSFPGCDRPPSHCQRHHITEWAKGGPTDLDNLTLLCGYHHREFAKRGWDCLMINGLPHWRPPAWLDPERTPIRNTRNFPLPDTG